MADGLEIILSDPDVKSVFVNVFGGITSCDAVADGIVQALAMLGDKETKPLVVRLDGNNVEEGHRILAEAAHPLVTVVHTLDGAAATAEVTRRAVAGGATEVVLYSDLTNAAAIRLYPRLGYAPVSDRAVLEIVRACHSPSG